MRGASRAPRSRWKGRVARRAPVLRNELLELTSYSSRIDVYIPGTYLLGASTDGDCEAPSVVLA